VEDVRAALGPKGGSAASEKIVPGVAVKAALLTGLNVALDISRGAYLAHASANLIFVEAKATVMTTELTSPIADHYWSLPQWHPSAPAVLQLGRYVAG